MNKPRDDARMSRQAQSMHSDAAAEEKLLLNIRKFQY